jgi:hypothetical protein
MVNVEFSAVVNEEKKVMDHPHSISPERKIKIDYSEISNNSPKRNEKYLVKSLLNTNICSYLDHDTFTTYSFIKIYLPLPHVVFISKLLSNDILPVAHSYSLNKILLFENKLLLLCIDFNKSYI